MKHFITALLLTLPTFVKAEIANFGTITHDGISREHYLFVPPDASETTPLVVAMHGMGGNAANLRFGIGLSEAATEANFAVVYPQGLRLPRWSRHWNAGMNLMQVDDLGYITALVHQITAEHGLSKDKTVVFGISMGGYMAYHLACQSDLQLSAVIAVAANISGSDRQSCASPRPASLLHIHGEKDPMIRYTGSLNWSGAFGGSPPVPELVTTWANMLDAEPAVDLVNHARVQERRHLNTNTGTEVQLLTLPDLGHDWPTESNAGFRALNPVVAFIKRHASELSDGSS